MCYMRWFVPEAFMRMPRRNLGVAVLFTLLGCVWVVLSISGFISPDQGIVLKSSALMITLGQFVLAGFFGLPDRRRRAKQWLRIAAVLLALAVLSLSIAIFVGAMRGQSI